MIGGANGLHVDRPAGLEAGLILDKAVADEKAVRRSTDLRLVEQEKPAPPALELEESFVALWMSR